MMLTRRAFTSCLGLATTATLLPRLASSAPRALTLLHTHTGETLITPYASQGQYDAVSLAKVDYLLRDFRTGEVHAMDPQLLDILFGLQVLADRDDAFEIICGYRSAATNANLRRKSRGVAEHSLHVQGQALDIRLSRFPTSRLRELALSLKRGGVGYYPKSDFIHVDTGRVRFW